MRGSAIALFYCGLLVPVLPIDGVGAFRRDISLRSVKCHESCMHWPARWSSPLPDL